MHLPTASTQDTKLRLNDEHDTVYLDHNGEITLLRLPAQITHGTRIGSCLPVPPELSIVTRLQVQNSPSFSSEDERVPWSAMTLGDAVEIRCQGADTDTRCNALLVERGIISQWKDLPSEGWAEMMDLWHCHKPHEPHQDNSVDAVKGYSANNTLTAKSGTGFVNEMAFLIAQQDCSNIKVGHPLVCDTVIWSDMLDSPDSKKELLPGPCAALTDQL